MKNHLAPVLLAALAFVLLSGQGRPAKIPDVIHARSFVLVDAKGRTVGSLSSEPDGPRLQLYTARGPGFGTVIVRVQEDGTASVLVGGDRKGGTVATLSCEPGKGEGKLLLARGGGGGRPLFQALVSPSTAQLVLGAPNGESWSKVLR